MSEWPFCIDTVLKTDRMNKILIKGGTVIDPVSEKAQRRDLLERMENILIQLILIKPQKL